MAKTVLPDGSSKYEGGGFTVVVAKDGAISVRSGDSLSKYSMAIHGNFNHINEYKHRRHKPMGPITDDDLAKIPNVDVINVGEILYHMPTRKDSDDGTKPGNPNQPIVVTREELLRWKHFPNVQVPFKDFAFLGLPYLKAGQSWMSKQGRRTIASIHTASASIIYLLENPMSRYHGKLILQSVTDFKDDLRSYFFDDLGRRLEGIHKLLEAEVYFFLGVISCINLPAFLAVTGITTAHWIITNRDWLAKVDEAIRISCDVRSFMLANTPTLYEKLINATLHHLWKEVPNIAGNVPEAIVSDPKLAGAGSGVILGHLTLTIAKNRFAIIGLVAKILLAIAVKAIQAAPGAIVLTAQERAQYGLEIVTNLREQEVDISDAEAQLIIDEVLANPDELQNQLRKLQEAFEAIK